MGTLLSVTSDIQYRKVIIIVAFILIVIAIILCCWMVWYANVNTRSRIGRDLFNLTTNYTLLINPPNKSPDREMQLSTFSASNENK